jgi:hypothetical protein
MTMYNVRRALACLALAVAAVGCNDPTYLYTTCDPKKPNGPSNHCPLETKQAMMGGKFMSDTDTFDIHIRRCTSDEKYALTQEYNALHARWATLKKAPFAGVRDLAVEVEYHVENLGDDPVRAFFQLTGGDEFTEYNDTGAGCVPAAHAAMGTGPCAYDPQGFVDPFDENAVVPPPLAGDSPVDLGPHEARDLVFREDEIAEAALDLEAIVRYPSTPPESTPFKVLTTRSDVSRVGLDNLPIGDITPQIVHLTFTLVAEGHVTASYVVRVRDFHGRVVTMPPYGGVEGRCL